MFDIVAMPKNIENNRCIRTLVPADTLVAIYVNVVGSANDGQKVNMTITDIAGNKYGHSREIMGKRKIVFTTNNESTIIVCINNVLLDGFDSTFNHFRTIELNINKGADALNWNEIEILKHLKPIEVELLRIEGISKEIAKEMDYMQRREQKMRDINESTNDRVKYYGLGFMISLVILGICEIVYLRRFFQRKQLI
ncbi:hypothetical protein T552_02041 [Pneumocystis carinii B80]|uniref:GOLD domain-containing protein n=1 Tax=Pneumocystis carinii (strain B80) TaxID=1408658 RepID=A0A0W4ZII7_PNEC8|nr:hypothetical protein T552_02041 [Pneumocystis carinii B80]KTW28182.1 hypothetical protein T552_02041 [Pneumocystis carinii B80]